MRFTPGLAVGLAVLVGVAGCARVAPYDRGKIAHPSMATGDSAGPGEAHVRAVQEGAIGGNAGIGGGCGCN